MIRFYRRGAFHIFYLVFLFLNSFVLLSQAGADAHFMDELGIIGFDEKIEAPDFALKDLNGQEVKLKDHLGKVVFVNFWTTWCPPCQAEMPSMEKLYAEFKNEDFTMLAIDLMESADRVCSFKDKEKLNFPILLDTDGVIGLKYGVRGLPTTYLVDRNGYIIGAALGPRDWASQEAFGLIHHLLNTSPAS